MIRETEPTTVALQTRPCAPAPRLPLLIKLALCIHSLRAYRLIQRPSVLRHRNQSHVHYRMLPSVVLESGFSLRYLF